MQEYRAIDLAKFLAAIMVAAIHSHLFFGSDDLYYITKSVFRIAVPFFFCTSSYLFFVKHTDLKKYISRILMMYLAWFIIELPYVIDSHFMSPNTTTMRNIVFFIRDLFLGNTFHASWYLTASVTSIAIVYYLRNKLSNITLLIIGVFLYLFSLSASSYFGIVDNTLLSPYNRMIATYFVPSNSFFVSFIYVVLGKIIAEGSIQITLKIQLLITALLLFMWVLEISIVKSYVRINDCYILLPPLSLLLVSLLLKAKVNISKNLSLFLRKSSILIYFLHYCFIEINVRLLGLSYGSLLFFIITIEAIFASTLIIHLSKKLKILKYFY